jgi:hypothetical protein
LEASTGSATGTYTASLYNRGYTNNVGLAWTIMKRTPTGVGAWSLNGLCSGASTAATTIRTSMSGFSDFATVQFGNPLPIELLSFNALLRDPGVLIHWTTLTEINNDYFIVEKSRNGTAFEPVGNIKGAGNSVAAINYEMYDRNPFAGVNYYKLKQVDYNGAYTYSDIVAVRVTKGDNEISIYPNPANEEINIVFSNSYEGIIEITAEDAIGQTVKHWKEKVNIGMNTIGINILSLPEGVYYLKLMKPEDDSTYMKQSSFVKGKRKE